MRIKADRLVVVKEHVCIFLHRLAHHVKNRTIGNRFNRSDQTTSKCFNSVLHGVLCLQDNLLKALDLVLHNSTDTRWKMA